MINAFYEAMKEAQMWFFGAEILADPFVAFFVNLFNIFILLVMFYALFMFPVKKCITMFKGWLDK